jgi:hypothetical protein
MNGSNDIFNSYLGFHKILIGTKGLATGTLILTGKCGHHDYSNIFCLGCRTKNIKHVKAADFWHHNVTDDKFRTLFNSHSKRFFPVTRGNNVVSLG